MLGKKEKKSESSKNISIFTDGIWAVSHLTCLSVFSNHLGLFRDWITQCFSLSSPDFTKSPCSHCHVMTKWLERVVYKHCPQFPFYGFFWTHLFRTSIPPLHRNRSGHWHDIHVNQPHYTWLAISRLLPVLGHLCFSVPLLPHRLLPTSVTFVGSFLFSYPLTSTSALRPHDSPHPPPPNLFLTIPAP